MTTKDLPILIAGGGIGGLSVALALSNKGISSCVLEQAPTFREVGAGLSIYPNIFKMFDKLGILESVLEFAVLLDDLIVMDVIENREIIRLHFGEKIKKRFHYPAGVIHRQHLLSVLLKECQKSPLIQLLPSSKVIETEQNDQTVTVKTTTDQIYKGKALIVADGIWSKLRTQLFNDEPPVVSGRVAYRGIVPSKDMPKDLQGNSGFLWLDPESDFVHFPLKGDTYQITAVFCSDQYEDGVSNFGTPDELFDKFKHYPASVLECLKHINVLEKWNLCDRNPRKNISKGLVTFLGDAAHTNLPSVAQGAAMAVEDAVVLADKIHKQKDNFTKAFKEYEEERYPRTSRITEMGRFLVKVFHADNFARELRNLYFETDTVEQTYDRVAWIYDGITV